MTTKGLMPLVVASLSCGLLSGAYGFLGLERPPIVDVGTLIVPLISALLWAQSDAPSHGIRLVHDWGLLAWVGWPLLLPWYGFKTRGKAGWRLVLLLFGLILGPLLAYPVGLLAGALLADRPSDETSPRVVSQRDLPRRASPGCRAAAHGPERLAPAITRLQVSRSRHDSPSFS